MKGPEKTVEEIIAENFPDIRRETVTQVQKAQRVPGRIDPRRNIILRVSHFSGSNKYHSLSFRSDKHNAPALAFFMVVRSLLH